jgi:hypothetical protein
MDTIVVYIENENKHFNLIHSLSLLSIKSHRLFEDEQWVSHFHKLKIYVDGLKNIDNEWVILSDSRDVLFYKNIDTINQAYSKYYNEFDIVVQAEDTDSGCDFFKTTGLKRYEFSNTLYKYPCSGLIMGKRKIIINFFEEILNKVPTQWAVADQPAIEWGMANLDYKITLDTNCHLFQLMGMGANSGVNFNLHFNKNFIKNTYTNSEPCIFHGAGNTFLNQIWKIINKRY